MVKAPTPSIAKIKKNASEADARALLYIAVCEVCDFFNVGKNMSESQVAATVDLIMESFGYLKLEEIKFCLRRAMRREELYDRLDGNIILRWLSCYAAERVEVAMALSENEENASRLSAPESDGGEITLAEYKEILARRKENGDIHASEILDYIESTSNHNHDLDRRELMRDKIAAEKFFNNLQK